MTGNFKVLFVYPDISRGASGKFYHGIAYLSSYLKRNGIDTSLIHLTKKPSKNDFLKSVEHEKCDLIAYTATTNMFPLVSEIVGWVKKKAPVPSVIGGMHATLAPEEVLSTGLFDAVCIGEGEDPLLELCRRLRSGSGCSGIESLWVRDAGGVTRSGIRPPRADLDELPFPDRDIMNYGNSVDVKLLKRGVFMASRGCPYDCSFCCNHSLKKLYSANSGRYVRFRSVANLTEEIETVISHYPSIDKIAFHDDILPLNKNWFHDFCKEFGKNIGLPFQLNCRAELVDADMLRLAKEAGCMTVSIGIESGSEEIRKKVLNRHMSDAVLRNAFNLCAEKGIPTYSYNMVGIPGETFHDMLKTLKFNASLDIDTIQYSIFYPYPGTALFEECRNKDLLSGKTSDSYFDTTTVLNFDRLHRSQIYIVYTQHSRLTRIYKAIFRIVKEEHPLTKIFDALFYFSTLFGISGFLSTLSKLKRFLQKYR